MAGYPSNTIQDLSIKLFEFAALGLATFGLTPIQWFKILVFLAMACVPWLIYFAGRNLFFDRDDIKNSAVRGIWDTQCGFKAFRAEVAERIFSQTTIEGWAFDVEVLA